MTPSPADVAQWMFEQIEKDGFLYQDDAAHRIETRFGVDFVYISRTYRRIINPQVLAAFTQLTGSTVVWEARYKSWRKRQPRDGPRRAQW